MSVRGEERSRKRYAVRDDERRPRRERPDYNETPVDGRALHVLRYIRKFHVSPSTDRTAYSHVFHRGTTRDKPNRLKRQKVGSDSEAL